MMHGVGVARADLYGLHIARLAETGREDEIPEGVGAIGRRREFLLGGDDEIGRTKLPTTCEFGRRGSRRWPLGHARLHPRFNGLDLCIGEPAFVLKFAVSRCGQPRRHVATPRDGYDLRRVFSGVVVREQWERPRASGMMARSAVRKQNRCDVAMKVDRLGG